MGRCCCNEPSKLQVSFSGPLKIMMVEDEGPQGYASLTITLPNRFSITARGDVMYTLPVGMGVKMQVGYTDAGGNPATVDGEVTWQSSNPAVLHIERDDDDTTICVVQATGGTGQVQVTAVADADLGDGVRNLVTTADIEVVAGEAVAGSIMPVGEPSPAEPVAGKH